MNKQKQIQELIYSWGGYNFPGKKISVFDTTLRDGLQSPHIKKYPSISQRIKFLELCYELGIEAVEIGFPVASESHKKEVLALARHAKRNKLNIILSCLSRTLPIDVQTIADISQEAGFPITVNLLIGSSKIRTLVEDWNLKTMQEWIKKSVKTALQNNLPVEFVTEDTTRSEPSVLRILYGTAIKYGVKRIWIADTVGEAVPNTAQKITAFFMKQIIKNHKVGLDWHGHDDKGLGVANALAAAEKGADRIQATALGVGERAGNSQMEAVIMNLVLAKVGKYNLKALMAYSECASHMFDIPIRDNYPIVGNLVYTTAAGMHAAAINKARQMKNKELEGIVYASFSSALVGQEMKIFIGPMSGGANVEWNLERLRIKKTPKLIEEILNKAKQDNRFLHDDEIIMIAKKHKE